MMHLDTHYRPVTFDEIVGQRDVVSTLKAALKSDTVPQQILFSGQSGVGKTTIARILCRAFYCEQNNDGLPCGVCGQCEQITAGTHPSVKELDAASNGNVDKIRELAESLAHKPIIGDYTCVIIDEAHGLTSTGQQAFLKLLEEPPEHVKFMLCTTDPEKVVPTIIGRCQQFTLTRPTPQELSNNLNRIIDDNGWPIPQTIVDAIVAATDPSHGVRGTLHNLQKTVSIIENNPDIDETELAATLGAVHLTAQTELYELLMGGNIQKTVDYIHQIRDTKGENVARQTLTSTLTKLLEQGNPYATNLLTYATTLKPGAAHTDLFAAHATVTSPAGQLLSDIWVTNLTLWTKVVDEAAAVYDQQTGETTISLTVENYTDKEKDIIRTLAAQHPRVHVTRRS